MRRRNRANITETAMRHKQLAETGDLWDGKTNPHFYDISPEKQKRWYSLRKRCQKCHGPVLNQLRVLTCQGCRAHHPVGLGLPSTLQELM